MFSNEFLAAAWFDIYKQVLKQNESLGEDKIKDELLTAVTTTIFIQAGQKGFLRPIPQDPFIRELVKITSNVKDRDLKKTIYEQVRGLVNSNGVKEVV